jgi:Uma2 family endonuclease
MLDPVVLASRPPLLTARELLARPERYKRGAELWDGVLLVREPSGGDADVVTCYIVEALSHYVRTRGLGWVTGSSHGYQVGFAPDRVLSPDVAYVSRARLPVHPRRGFTPLAPDFAVEVRSPTDARDAVMAKAGVWLAHGTAVVWVVDPEAREVIVVRPTASPEVVRAPRCVSAHPVLPRFRMPVARILPRP